MFQHYLVPVRDVVAPIVQLLVHQGRVRATEAGVPHVRMENPGNHGGRWPERYQTALQWLSETLEHAPA